MRGGLFILFLVSSYSFSFSQHLTQTLKGKVMDEVSLAGVSGASIFVEDQQGTINHGSVTDSLGNFEIHEVPIGRYSLTFRHVNYKYYVEPEIELKSAKPLIFQIYLVETVQVLDEVVVESEGSWNLNSPNKRPITVEQTLRYAANYYDPARLSTSFPNVIAANDQANNLVIKGNTPNSMNWKLQGANILNPNHLTNAGTFSDRPTQNGGGVTILSSQVLATSDFLSGTFDAEYGNSLSGVMDLNFKAGNESDFKFMGQASLLGLEFAAEGPLSKNGGSFLVNYRYSTVGLLSAMGVDFGGEKIYFQDLSFNMVFPESKAGEFTFFGIGGISSNRFTALRDSTEWEVQKDRSDILYDGKMAAIGITHSIRLGSRTSWRSVVAFSTKQDFRESWYLNDLYTSDSLSLDDINSDLLSIRTEFSSKIGKGKTLLAGVYFDGLEDDLSSFIENTTTGNSRVFAWGELKGWMIQPYMAYSHNISAKFSYELGIRYNYFTWNSEVSAEPRASVYWFLSDRQTLYFRYGSHSQRQRSMVYLGSEPGTDLNDLLIHPNLSLGFSKSSNFVAGTSMGINENTTLAAEIYYQIISDVPVERSQPGSFSVLNLLEQYASVPLVNTGKGSNYGLEVSLQRTFSKDFYYLTGVSLSEANYKGSDDVSRDARYNSRYSFHFTGGKEFRKISENKEKVFGVNLKLLYLGGFRDTPIDLAASRTNHRTIYIEDEAFEIKLNDYVRLDLRLSWEKNKPKYTRTWSIDIQNVLNIENDAFYYYDTQQDDVLLEKQLGIIPVLAYRVEF